MATQAERSAATRRKLLASARALFVTVGYEATTTSMILTASGVSRGAMYYHFDSKESIFEELYMQTARSVTEAISGSGAGDATLVDSCLAWLAEASRPDSAAILLELGPSVLGWPKCRQLEAEHGLALSAALRGHVELLGAGAGDSAGLSAAMLAAALAEAARILAHAPGPHPGLDDARSALVTLVGRR